MEKLLCPYCGGEMRRGWLRSRRSDIWWEPDPAASSDEEMRCIAAAAAGAGPQPPQPAAGMTYKRRAAPHEKSHREAVAFLMGLASNGQTC